LLNTSTNNKGASCQLIAVHAIIIISRLLKKVDKRNHNTNEKKNENRDM